MSASSEIAVGSAKIAPSAGVATLELLGVPLQDWVIILTVCYTALLLLSLGWDFIWKVVERRRTEKNRARNHCRRASDPKDRK